MGGGGGGRDIKRQVVIHQELQMSLDESTY